MHPAVIRLTLPLLLVAIACDPDGPEPLTGEEEARLAARGAEVAGALQAQLGSTLQRRIREEGLVEAVEFCDVQALPLTRAVAEEEGVRVGRTSDRIRNPDNAPDSLDRRALAAFRGTAPGDVSHRLEVEADSAVRYYQPLYANELCVRCHGSVETLDPALRSVLEERYPEDEATGYAPGDVRGVIRVTLPREAGSGDGNR